MKILKLHIDQFRHLENLDFDFTYQTGKRKGQILDKICFIGQSATGKTGLLESIYEHISNIKNLELIDNMYLAGLNNPVKNINGEINILFGNEVLSLKNKQIIFKGEKYKFENKGGTVTPLIPYQDQNDIFYFKANLISDKNIEIFTKSPIDLFEQYYSDKNIFLKKIGQKKIDLTEFGTIFNDEVDTKIWISLIEDILEYRKNFTQKMSELIHKGLLADTKKLSTEFQKWQKENTNVLESFAEKFNPILEKLNLEVDLVNTEYSIPIKNKKTDEIIPIQNTSTGTKGLLLSFLPLFKLDTKDSIILIDEPERSLYPDMQMDLMDHYKNLAPEAQFIVATHSPFIAASFEADERFILYFDEDGKVAVRRGSSPIGDDPNDMLENDFGINYINKFGQEKYEEYLELKQQIYFEKDETKKKKISEKLEKLGEEYNF
ncbi:AAA family ATPase [Flavobacterium faecale]|uniref:AAA family ATPase n=1 Tax=Flavobacterium faecale TaxID=1355330 RepID=UPI003AAF6CBA